MSSTVQIEKPESGKSCSATHLDLCSGIGGFALAANWAGFQTVGFCEKEEFCCEVLRKHWPDVTIFNDLTQLTIDDARRAGIERVDLLTAGFPCQDISAAGGGAGLDGGKSSLWYQVRRLIGEVEPVWCVIENSPLLRIRGADIVLKGLEDDGYTCWPVVVGADDAGAPHIRKRVFILAYRNCFGVPPRAEQPGRAARADACWCSPGTAMEQRKMGDAYSERQQEQCLTVTVGTEIGRAQCSGGDLADSHGDEPQRERNAGGMGGAAATLQRDCAERQRIWDTASDRGETARLADLGRTERFGWTSTDGRGRCGEAEPRRCDGRGCGEGITGATQPGLVRVPDGLSRRMDLPGPFARWPARPGEEQHDYEPPRTVTKTKDRAARLKAIGNAIVPQVVYPILAAIYGDISGGGGHL